MEHTVFYKRKLPHYQPKDGVFFITTRLDFQIPQKYLIALNQYHEALRIQYSNPEDESENKRTIAKIKFAYEDDLYSKCTSDIDLTQQSLGNIIKAKLLSMSVDTYYLYSFTIMPNHLHLLIKPLSEDDKPQSLSDILKSIKGHTARMINQELNRNGSVWQREFYDHWVRDQQELINIIEYIRNNPLKAGLVNDPIQWPWTWLNPDLWQ